MRSPLAFALAASLLFAAGCGHNAYFSDDEGAPRPAAGSGDHPDELSQPYALGTKVKVSVNRLDAAQAAAYKLVSDTPGVFSVDKITVDKTSFIADCTAAAEGDVTIHLRDGSGGDVRTATIKVRAPDKARVYAHGPLRILGNSASVMAAAEVSELRVLAGGTAVFPIAYFRGADRVYGRGLYSPVVDPSVTAVAKTSSGAPSNEWLFVTPSAAGTTQVGVRVAGQTLATLPLVTVGEAELGTATLDIEQGELKNDDQKVWVFANVRDMGGRPVYGVYAGWTLDGLAQIGTDNPQQTMGDLFRFEYNPKGSPRTLAMKHGTIQAMTTIQAHQGWVFDTTYLGCSLGGRRAGAPVVAAGLLLLGLGLIIRRRRA